MNTRERRIRELAYRLWDHAGRAEGGGEGYWLAATAEVERNEEAGRRKSGAPVRKATDMRCETAADWGLRGRDPSF
ncbi:DUF2934 domain-containing protein [Roseiarcus fermentans]|uniref:DUF2934 domain-containing protein n=1 Tax=Roseiarcus fermentans TaxID=1473586 RepID=UPI00147615EE